LIFLGLSNVHFGIPVAWVKAILLYKFRYFVENKPTDFSKAVGLSKIINNDVFVIL
jgi:hypothetical protein